MSEDLNENVNAQLEQTAQKVADAAEKSAANGQDKTAQIHPQAQSRPNVNQQLEMFAGQPLAVMINGILHSMQGAPPDLIALAIGRAVGRILAGTIAGDLTNILKYRKALRDGFVEAVNKTPMPPAPSPPQGLKGLKIPK